MIQAEAITAKSGCKVNLLLNILGRRNDGFHELETVMVPVPVFDELRFWRTDEGVSVTCNVEALSTGEDNLVMRAARKFFERSDAAGGAKIHLEKRLPIGGGIGAGSANAAVTLISLNKLHGSPLEDQALLRMAAELGSDVPFFLRAEPAMGTGRGENVVGFEMPPSDWTMVLIFPGFGVSTPWAYKELIRYPEVLQGKPGRAAEMKRFLEQGDMDAVCDNLYNSLEGPVFNKYPVLQMYQNFLKMNGAAGVLMTGSGSTTFAIFRENKSAARAMEKFQEQFGRAGWIHSIKI